MDALEPLHKYEAKLQGRVASLWRNCYLEDVVCDLLLTTRPSSIFGFFAGETYWSNAGAKYRYFFTSGMRRAQQRGLKTQLSGYFHRYSDMLLMGLAAM